MIPNTSFGNMISIVVFSFLLYTARIIFRRLFLNPLSKYPGPKLAAATYWYEFYYEVVKRNRFSWEIERMHDVYGTKFPPLTKKPPS